MKTALCVLALVCACLVITGGSAAPQQQHEGGGWSVGVDQNRGGRPVVRADANKKWDLSKNGNVKAEVSGYVVRGGGEKDHGVGVSISGKFK